MGAKVGTDGAFDDMNLTPLIDVVLVVLIILMVSMPVKVQQMDVKVPDPSAKPPDTPPPEIPPDQLVVAIYADGGVALNRRLMEPTKVSFELGRRLRNMTKKNVFVDADVTVEYAKVIEMIEIAKSAGAAKVGLAKVKENGPQPYLEVDSGAMPRGVFIGSPIVSGMITEKRADDAFQQAKGALRSCYETALASDSKLTGRVMFSLLYNPDGSQYEDPAGIRESPNIVSNGLVGNKGEIEACMLEALKGLRSTPLGEGNTGAVTHPVIFSPG